MIAWVLVSWDGDSLHFGLPFVVCFVGLCLAIALVGNNR